jgi:predicted O-linked N-acetylglucosamine transferase (SPINDLY family)
MQTIIQCQRLQWLEQMKNYPLLPFPMASLRPQLQQAFQYLLREDYIDAIALYQQALEANPAEPANYWYLGLTQLLLGEEAEAQTTWLSVMMAAEPEEIEAWTAELVQVLETEAERRELMKDDQVAWVIRRHIGELVPDYLDNLLLLIQQFARLEIIEDLDTVLSQTIAVLPSVESINSELLVTTLKNAIEFAPEMEEVAEFAIACADIDHCVIDCILAQTAKLTKQGILPKSGLMRWVQLCHQLQPDNISIAVNLINLYQDTQQYAKSLELTEQLLSRSQNKLDTVAAYYLKIRCLLNSGSNLAEAAASHTIYEQLLLELISSAEAGDLQIDRNHRFNLISTISFFSYLADTPQHTNQFRQKFSTFWQSLIQTHFSSLEIDQTRNQPINCSNRTLKIGYLSSCLTRHSIGSIARWLFQHHDRDRFSIYAYSLNQTNDSIQQFIVNTVSEFRDLSADKTIPEIVEAIKQDEIDILVDLDSLTSNICCAVMALKPAPIQVTWLGFDASEISTIDYFLADPYVLPESAQNYYNEKIWRLPQTYIAVDGFEVGVPTLRREDLDIPPDAVIYFSSQTGAKRHPDHARLQLKILRDVPNSYFLVKGLYTDRASIQTFFEQLAKEEGVEFDRLRFLPDVPSEATHRANLSIADVVLDTYPYNGTTTTLETLWMEVPVVTRVGEQFSSRQGYTLLTNAGITEGIARTNEDYLEWGIRLGKDAQLRQQIAWKLRRAKQTAPLWNTKQFALDMENAYQQMWEQYLERK